MPKGQAFMRWDNAKDAKLLLTILNTGISINYAKIAEQFSASEGVTVPASCISTRIANLRKKVGKSGTQAKEASGSTRAPSLAKGVVIKKEQKEKKRKRASPSSDEDTGDEEGANDADTEMDPNTGLATPVALPLANKREKRASPRDAKVKDYKALDDPYSMAEIHDADGNPVFGPERSASEDSNPSDAGWVYGAGKVKAAGGSAMAV